jgi:hypothetical protein
MPQALLGGEIGPMNLAHGRLEHTPQILSGGRALRFNVVLCNFGLHFEKAQLSTCPTLWRPLFIGNTVCPGRHVIVSPICWNPLM